MKNVKLVNKRRFITSTLLTLILVSLIITSVLSLTGNLVSSAMEVEHFESYTVRSGDTLWKIAKRIQQDNQDIRDLIHTIVKENKLDNEVIHPGQELMVPSEVTNYVANADY